MCHPYLVFFVHFRLLMLFSINTAFKTHFKSVYTNLSKTFTTCIFLQCVLSFYFIIHFTASVSLSRSTRTLEAVLSSFEKATRMDPTRYEAWHAWALVNFRAVDEGSNNSSNSSNNSSNSSNRSNSNNRNKTRMPICLLLHGGLLHNRIRK